jgi:hypothetical protein
MDPHCTRDGITLQSRTLSHYLIVRRVAELVGDAARLQSMRREWSLDLGKERLPAVWEAVRAAIAAESSGGAKWEPVLVEDRHDEWNAVLSDGSGCAVRLQVGTGAAFAWVYAPQERAARVVAAIDAGLAAVAKVTRDDLMNVRFWHRTSDGADDTLRRIQCPRWDEIAGNYPECGGDLQWLMHLDRPWEHGRLVFWHGPPGTGKTWALRSLLREWSRMSAEVITDPDEFFASNAYLQQILLADPPLQHWSEEGSLRPEERPRLFIVEDAPQLVLQESRASQGTRMANLLSMTDGILGQGLRAVFVITTNEKLHRIDPAIRRPGRCLQEAELPAFTREQAERWLRERRAAAEDSPATAPRPAAPAVARDDLTLAELYELLHGRTVELAPDLASMGFAVRRDG